MKIADGLYCLKETSSIELYLKAVNEMRRVEFKKFKILVLHRLAKELHLKLHLFSRPFIEIHYRASFETPNKHKHYLPPNDELLGSSFGGISGFFLSPPIGTETFKKYAVSEVESITRFHIGSHISNLHQFLTNKKNVLAVGIFLKSSSPEVLEDLRDRMKSNKPIDFGIERYSLYDYANILKLYLQQMEEPFFVSKYYAAYEKISELERSYQQLEHMRLKAKSKSIITGRLLAPDSELRCREKTISDSIQLIVQLMPGRRREILGYIIDILEAVVVNSDFNRMGAGSLGVIFAPLLFFPRGLPRDVKIGSTKNMSYVVTRMIKLGRRIFDPPSNLLTDVWENTRELRSDVDLTTL